MPETPALDGVGVELREVAEELAELPDVLKASVRNHVRTMYPKAAEAGGPSFILSIGNHTSNAAHNVVLRALSALSAAQARVEGLEGALRTIREVAASLPDDGGIEDLARTTLSDLEKTDGR